MATGMRPTQDYDPETDPEYETALRAYLASIPSGPDVNTLGRRTGQFLANAGTSLPQSSEDYRTNQFLDLAAKHGVVPPEEPTAATGPADISSITVRRTPSPPRNAPPPMTAPVAALQSMTDGTAPSRAEQIAAATGDPVKLDALLTPGFKPVGRSTGTVTSEELTPPATTPEGEAVYRDLLAAGAAGRGASAAATPIPGVQMDPALPDASMPALPAPAPASVPELEPKTQRVQIGQAAHVDVPNTAVVQSRDPGAGRAPPTTAPPASPDPVHRALTAAALSARPPQGDTDLEAALQAAAGRRLVAGLARAGGSMIGRGQGAAYDALDREAEAPLQDFEMRHALSTEQQQQAALRAAADAARGKEAFSEKMQTDEFGLKKSQAEETARHNRAEEALKGKKLAGGGGGAQGLSKEAAKELAVLQRQWDPSGPRSGERGKNQARVNAAGRIEALASGPDGKVADLSPQQMTELARQLDTLLSNGGQATEGVTRALSAHTASGKVAELEQWLTSSPHGAGQRAFVQQMLETARREKDVAGGQLRDSYISTLPSVPTLLKERPDVIQNMLRANGVDPEGLDLSTGLRRPNAAPAPAPRPPAAGMVRIRDPKTGRTGWAKPNAVPPGAEVMNGA